MPYVYETRGSYMPEKSLDLSEDHVTVLSLASPPPTNLSRQASCHHAWLDSGDEETNFLP